MRAVNQKKKITRTKADKLKRKHSGRLTESGDVELDLVYVLEIYSRCGSCPH